MLRQAFAEAALRRSGIVAARRVTRGFPGRSGAGAGRAIFALGCRAIPTMRAAFAFRGSKPHLPRLVCHHSAGMDSNNGERHRPRRQRGTPAGGQFAPGNRPRPGFELGADNDPPASPDPGRLGSASTEELWDWVRHPDPAVQAEALEAPGLSDEQLLALAEPDRPLSVRYEVAVDRRPLSGLVASDDPDPAVRALVSLRADTPEALRTELLSDPAVVEARRRLASDPVLHGLFVRASGGETTSE